MSQLTFFQPPSWTVTELTQILRQVLENDVRLQNLWVAGEVSNVSRPSSGHLYFTLKDRSASLRAVMWKNNVARQDFLPREGDAIEAHGGIGVYEVNGVYQLYVDLIRPSGEGVLYQEFLRLKARLEAEGLFTLERKRIIPRWPGHIGIVTSPTAAALRDMLNTLRRRYPLARVTLAPTQVQGAEAPAQIVAALEEINQVAHPDVILLARGGGSIEDLWAFNDERVARAIVASLAPVISGVGHETDFTIADFAADLRAPTPTAAAELATPDQQDLRAALYETTQRLERAASACLADPRLRLHDLQSRLLLNSPRGRLRTDRQRLDDFTRRAGTAILHRLQLQKAALNSLEQRLAALNPQAVLERGYALVLDRAGQMVHTVEDVHPGDELRVHVSDGKFDVSVLDLGRNAA
jgi:exodeoxyribonuclease VII large subunit